MKETSRYSKKELIELANIAGLLKETKNRQLYNRYDGELNILCDDGTYRDGYDLKMMIDPSGEYANMS
jgi:hypothetical protein